MFYRLLFLLFIITGVIANQNHEREPRFFFSDGVLEKILGFFDTVEPWCSSVAAFFCKEIITIFDFFDIATPKQIGCGIQIGCKLLDTVFDKYYSEGRAAQGRSLGFGGSMEEASEDLKVMRDLVVNMTNELEDEIQEMAQEVNLAEIKKLYGDDLNRYFSIRKKFNSMTITREGGIMKNNYSEDFLAAVNDKENGLGLVSKRIYLMLVGTSSTQSLFKALPESCNQVNFFVRVISDSALLGNLAMTLTETKVQMGDGMLKNAIISIYNQFVFDCGFPPETVEKVQSNLRSLTSPDLRSLNNTKNFGEVEEL